MPSVRFAAQQHPRGHPPVFDRPLTIHPDDPIRMGGRPAVGGEGAGAGNGDIAPERGTRRRKSLIVPLEKGH
ncbi:hypothetical protein GCM10023085_34430 [Actinomadura viridis]